ncbi:DUF3888 domain-containing protein [Filobacillus milosensis]|uniref:DUF3888 domain-containing protein n=1 Tax=Filobacillus milosensis TaxID=94137 RepID=A0A4Y8IQG9_9BACI|nr:DUF3888 domain-containing protein [Filobacillus milosensis]TFB23904.1 DUF3888 domain-containing protein [Filobacillus milosensis]
MRNIIVITVFLLVLFVPIAEASAQTDYEKALISLMFEDIHKTVDEYYGFEGVQFFDEEILELKMTGGLSFDVAVKISTFIGAHNTIGTDTLKFRREVEGLKLISYNHIPSEHKEEILEWYFNRSVHP